jgi:hypothetical protein
MDATVGWDLIVDQDGLIGLAPEAMATLGALTGSAAAATVAAQLDSLPALGDYAEQFVGDVSMISESQRAGLADALGSRSSGCTIWAAGSNRRGCGCSASSPPSSLIHR